MLVTPTISLFATTLLLSTTSAAPTRTHCRCTVVADTAAITTHWTPTEPSPSPLASDTCWTLGAELEKFKHTEPELYAAYLSRPEQASSTTGNHLIVSPRASSTDDARQIPRPRQRILCHEEPDAITAYQSSPATLCILQMIVAMAIMACIAEGIHLTLRWCGTPDSAMVPLHGSQKLLVEVLDSEKEARTMGSMPLVVVQAPNGDSACVTYDEDDDFDDEMNRPVM